MPKFERSNASTIAIAIAVVPTFERAVAIASLALVSIVPCRDTNRQHLAWQAPDITMCQVTRFNTIKKGSQIARILLCLKHDLLPEIGSGLPVPGR